MSKLTVRWKDLSYNCFFSNGKIFSYTFAALEFIKRAHLPDPSRKMKKKTSYPASLSNDSADCRIEDNPPGFPGQVPGQKMGKHK